MAHGPWGDHSLSLPKLFTMALAARGLLATAVLVALAASHAAAADDIT